MTEDTTEFLAQLRSSHVQHAARGLNHKEKGEAFVREGEDAKRLCEFYEMNGQLVASEVEGGGVSATDTDLNRTVWEQQQPVTMFSSDPCLTERDDFWCSWFGDLKPTRSKSQSMKTILKKGTPSNKGTRNIDGKVRHGKVFLRCMRTALL